MSTNMAPEESKYRVVLSTLSLLLGAVVAHVVFAIALWATTGMAGQWFLIFLAYSALPVWIVGITAGMALGVALRRIRNQWIHVAAFFLAGALMCAQFGAYHSVLSLSFPISLALAAAIGRLAVWKLVRINDPLSPLAP
ncbi:hypothetical protein [Arthrobacter cavernae]|uniref:Uncharacterized protein n=1 Tax=Arthrobacter cavernae TaxID=2817681 RepID=A0A939HM05_9MICC|nr:hypothetical protein [Arthrobacter cavernae]MBO1269810.1 hypothetical protein [Arthrobacter cavernae]